ncbi:hypothetical protein GCM10009753_31470 [Streptantibioticus ferralitis]
MTAPYAFIQPLPRLRLCQSAQEFRALRSDSWLGGQDYEVVVDGDRHIGSDEHSGAPARSVETLPGAGCSAYHDEGRVEQPST